MLLASPSRGEEKALVPPVAPLTSMDVLDNQWLLKPGDMVAIRIEGDGRKDTYEILPKNGVISCPYVGNKKAAGLTPRALAFQLKADLKKRFSRDVSVLVMRTHYHPRDGSVARDLSPHVILFGFVAKQGLHDFSGSAGLTVSGLIRRAGGITSKRRIPKIVLCRKTPQGNKRILVNTQAVLIEKRSEYDLFLRPDDVVIVE